MYKTGNIDDGNHDNGDDDDEDNNNDDGEEADGVPMTIAWPTTPSPAATLMAN